MKESEKTQATTFDTLPDFLNVQQVQKALGIGRKGVYKLIDSKQINCFKIGNAYKIPKSALISYIAQSCKNEMGCE